MVALSAVTAACNFLTTEDDPRRPPDVFDKVRAIDLLPRFPQQIATQQTGRGDGGQPATFIGTGSPTNGGSSLANVVGAQPAPNGEGFELNFVNTPVTGVFSKFSSNPSPLGAGCAPTTLARLLPPLVGLPLPR